MELYVQYENILFFTTGAPREPPLKYDPPPSVSFEDKGPYPRGNTCSNTLFLPLMEMDFKHFLYYVTNGIINTAGFGLV